MQLDSCLNELLEQYHSMQEDLERRLVERDEEVRRLRNLNTEIYINVFSYLSNVDSIV